MISFFLKARKKKKNSGFSSSDLSFLEFFFFFYRRLLGFFRNLFAKGFWNLAVRLFQEILSRVFWIGGMRAAIKLSKLSVANFSCLAWLGRPWQELFLFPFSFFFHFSSVLFYLFSTLYASRMFILIGCNTGLLILICFLSLIRLLLILTI